MTSFVPQIVKISRERAPSSVPLRIYLVTVSGFVLWIVYGVLTGSWPVAASFIVYLAMSAAVLALKWSFRRHA